MTGAISEDRDGEDVPDDSNSHSTAVEYASAPDIVKIFLPITVILRLATGCHRDC
jgi:hypothetical protein